jgi:hypothetical protein
VTKLEQIEAVEAALKAVTENLNDAKGCGCCGSDKATAALSDGLDKLTELLPPMLAELKMEADW